MQKPEPKFQLGDVVEYLSVDPHRETIVQRVLVLSHRKTQNLHAPPGNKLQEEYDAWWLLDNEEHDNLEGQREVFIYDPQEEEKYTLLSRAEVPRT